jgi:ribosomal protein S18 acetylase RimI-like enzyme
MPAAIRRMVDADVPFAIERMLAEGWAATDARVHLHLRHDPDGCFVAEVGGSRAGMVTTTAFGQTAWIGNLIVAPPFRGHGIGTALMRHCVAVLEARGFATIRLEADPMGEGIYRRLGFVDEVVSRRYWLRERPLRLAPEVVRLDRRDLPAILTLDAPAFGDARGRLLDLVLAQSSQCLGVKDGARLVGFACVVPTQTGFQIGPCIAATPEVGRALVDAALATDPQAAAVLGVAESNPAAVAIYESLGFLPNPPSRRMVLGTLCAAGLPGQVFAVASGACG